MFGLVRFIVHIFLTVIEFFLALRIAFIFFGANPATPFVSWIYQNSAPLVSPFAHIFPIVNLGGFIIDSSALVALIVFALIGSLLLQIFSPSVARY